MGKAVIHSSLGAGRYWVDIKYNTKLSDAMKARLTSRISDLETLISTCEAAIVAEESKLLDANNASPPAEWKVIFAIKTRLNEYKRKRWRAVLEKESHTQKIASLDLLIGTIRREAWCADRTTDLAGEVGTIEPHGIQAETPILQPGYGGNADYDGDRDGCLQHAQATVPEATFWNLAMLPGWQKWVPLYRTGTILTLDKLNDTATVTLDAAESPQHPLGQDIDLNVEEILQDIPVDYMNCNADAFAVGDHVVVWFEDQEWTKPKVIGFVDHPKPCGEYLEFRTRIFVGGGAVVGAVVVWDTTEDKPVTDKGFTCPCSIGDEAYIAWRETVTNAGADLFTSTLAADRNSGDFPWDSIEPGETQVISLPSDLQEMWPGATDTARWTYEQRFSGEELLWERLFYHHHLNAWGTLFINNCASNYGKRQQDYDSGTSPVPPPEYGYIVRQSRFNWESHSLEGTIQEWDDTYYVNGQGAADISYSDCYRDLSMGEDLWGYDENVIPASESLPVIEQPGEVLDVFSGYVYEPITYYVNDDPDDPTKDDPPPYGGNVQAKFVYDYTGYDDGSGAVGLPYPPVILLFGAISSRTIYYLSFVAYLPRTITKRKYTTLAIQGVPSVTTPYYNETLTYDDREVYAAAYYASGGIAARTPLPQTRHSTLSQAIVDAYEMAYTLASQPSDILVSAAYVDISILKNM